MPPSLPIPGYTPPSMPPFSHTRVYHPVYMSPSTIPGYTTLYICSLPYPGIPPYVHPGVYHHRYTLKYTLRYTPTQVYMPPYWFKAGLRETGRITVRIVGKEEKQGE